MNIVNYIKNLILFPFIRGQVTLDTTKKDFLNKLNKVTDSDFDLGRSFNIAGEKYTHEYQCEINGNKFKLRRIQSSSFKVYFTGTIVYGKLIETDGKLCFKYFMVFNIFTNLLFLGGLYAFFHSIITQFTSSPFDYTFLIYFFIFYVIFIILFASDVSNDIGFVKGLIHFNTQK